MAASFTFFAVGAPVRGSPQTSGNLAPAALLRLGSLQPPPYSALPGHPPGRRLQGRPAVGNVVLGQWVAVWSAVPVTFNKPQVGVRIRLGGCGRVCLGGQYCSRVLPHPSCKRSCDGVLGNLHIPLLYIEAEMFWLY